MWMRSKLFVPGSRPELFPKAAKSEADAISFDLEDAVAPERKPYARESVSAFLREQGVGWGKLVIVRVNAMTTPWFEDDIAVMAATPVDMINLPKLESAADVHRALEAMARAGCKPEMRILANVETPRGVRLAAEIAGAGARIAGLQLGLADLFLPLGIDRENLAARSYVGMAVRLAAGEAGIPAYDAAFTDISRPELCRLEAEAARSSGYAGKTCIHPSQVRIANEVFAPRAHEVEHAQHVIAAADAAATEGRQAFVVDGKLIDAPMILHARAVVSAAQEASRNAR